MNPTIATLAQRVEQWKQSTGRLGFHCTNIISSATHHVVEGFLHSRAEYTRHHRVAEQPRHDRHETVHVVSRNQHWLDVQQAFARCAAGLRRRLVVWNTKNEIFTLRTLLNCIVQHCRDAASRIGQRHHIVHLSLRTTCSVALDLWSERSGTCRPSVRDLELSGSRGLGTSRSHGDIFPDNK